MRRHRLLCVPKRHYYSLKEIPRASIVIPTMRNVALRTCLDSLRAIDGDGVTFEVLVVLNDASAEIELIAADFRDAITIIRSPVNLGVSGGFNLGFGAARGEYLIQLQDDAIVEPGWLKHLVERADATRYVSTQWSEVKAVESEDAALTIVFREGGKRKKLKLKLVDGTLEPAARRLIDSKLAP